MDDETAEAVMDQVEDVTEEALRYLGAKEDERLAPRLASFLTAAVGRLDRQRGPHPMGDVEWNGHAVTRKELALLIESWLATGILGSPLWPKGYEPKDTRPRMPSDGIPFPGPPNPIVPRDDRPEWMKRRWV